MAARTASTILAGENRPRAVAATRSAAASTAASAACLSASAAVASRVRRAPAFSASNWRV
ncbi:hypothetical protein D3C85_287820 [compost metagenome]